VSQDPAPTIVCRHLGLRDYETVWREMQAFTDQRTPKTPDEFWLTEHPPVYTLGLNGKPEHLLAPGDIPVVQCDRGGQVTYHGPGQIVLYLLLDLRRRKLGVKTLVHQMEQALINLLQVYDIPGQRRAGAPGIYVGDAKIAALGLRVRKGCCYHGLSLNVDMDLEPFSRINPCGYAGLATTQVCDQRTDIAVETLIPKLLRTLEEQVSHTHNLSHDKP
jgi:lipoyl(octanoyl) transferase